MILASLKPYYYYLIGERKKTIEVRKSALKDLPQDIVFYMSKDEKSFAKIPKKFQGKYREHFGKIGIRAVVDKIGKMKMIIDDFGNLILLSSIAIWGFNHCLSNDELDAYLDGKTGYGWHISDLKIYDKPKELSEFWGRKKCLMADTVKCWNCPATCLIINGKNCQPLTRPPQSYMYVKELGE